MMVGLMIYAGAFLEMSRFSLQMDWRGIAATGFAQGLATGLLFTPMSILAFGTLPARLRPDGTGFFTLARNMGNSAGISIMQAVYTNQVQVVHARLAAATTSDNPMMRAPYLPSAYSLSAPAGVAAFNAAITRQAAMVSNVDVFYLMFGATLVAAPLVLLLKPPQRSTHRIEMPIEH
jgi:DHA2 family multidrug resistance protein